MLCLVCVGCDDIMGKNKYNFKPLLLKDQIGAYLIKNEPDKKLIIWRNFGRPPKFRGGDLHG